MRKVSDTIRRLASLRPAVPTAGGHAHGNDRLTELGAFGSNPGALRGRIHIPDDLPEHAPLVVVLHGCTQTAAGYDHGSGWSRLADRAGFAVLFPEQQRANNANLCFNWFDPQDNRRDRGEALSIRQMIGRMIEDHGIDPARIFVTGLSAGGAMTSVMLAGYPELFAGGAIIAGLPYGTARSVPEAFDRMRGHGGPDERALTALVRAASDHRGPWPTISVWHGTRDATVALANADAIIAQWHGIHGVGEAPDRIETVDGQTRRVWLDQAGRAVIEDYRVAGMGHGTPLDTLGEDGCGVSGAYMLESGISSTRHIARFWGLDVASPRTQAAPGEPRALPAIEAVGAALRPDPAPPPGGVGKIIEDALRAAGLMR